MVLNPGEFLGIRQDTGMVCRHGIDGQAFARRIT